MTTTWLVTGAAGFLGANAGLWLGDRAIRVGQSRVIPPSGPFDRNIALDLRDAAAAAELVRSIRPNVILHGAAISGHETSEHDPMQAYAVNVVASRAISEAAAEVGAYVIYISTDSVFSGAEGNYVESDAPSPFSYYGETKLAGEIAVQESGAKALIVRTNFFGWSTSGRRSVLEFFVNALRSGQDVKGYPDFIVTSIYVRSLIETLWTLAQMGTEGIVHVASSDAVSKHDYGVAVAGVFGLDERLISPEHSAAGGHATSRSRDISLNTDLLTSLLGVRPETQEEGLRRAFADEATVRTTLREMDWPA